jgi:hypothetical protein
VCNGMCVAAGSTLRLSTTYQPRIADDRLTCAA